MNYIGKKLKSLRQELGLTQTEMAAGVISVSFYSKVERGLNDIGVNDFLDILQEHNISPQKFFEDFKTNKDSRKQVLVLMNRFINAAYGDNDLELKKIIKALELIKPKTAFIKFSLLQANLIEKTHDTNAINQLDKVQKNKIKKVIFQKDTDENEYHRIILLANIIQIYSFDEASFLINNIINRYQKVDKLDKNIMVALSVLMINYTDLCYKEKKYSLCSLPLKYVEKLPNDIELAFTKILGKYYNDLIKDKKVEAKNIRDVLIQAGYNANVKKMVR
ncbi:helix-turn-helix domain-containing protein [Lactobacillus kimbladii]|uniref:helix-turn-helix domain-containing protein n=1 Tax=Lactobacillus kimbladii TaxID=1218506 RepID=UPI003AF44D6F